MWAMPSRRRTTFPTFSSRASKRRPCASLSCLTGIIAGLPLGRQLGSTSLQNANAENYRFFPGSVLVLQSWWPYGADTIRPPQDCATTEPDIQAEIRD